MSVNQYPETTPVQVADNGGSLTVDDGGGSLTVDGPLTDTQLRASALNITASTPLDVQLANVNVTDDSLNVRFDVSSQVEVCGFEPHGSPDSGDPPVKIGGLASTSVTPVDAGDITDAWFNTSGCLGIHDGGGSITVDGTVAVQQAGSWSTAVNDGGGTVSIDDGGGSITVDGTVTVSGVATAANQSTEITSLQLIDDIVHAADTALSKTVCIGGQYDDTSTSTVSENNVSPVRITSARGLHTNLRNVSGTEIGTTSNPLNVSGPSKSTTGSLNMGSGGNVELDVTGCQVATAWLTPSSWTSGSLYFYLSPDGTNWFPTAIQSAYSAAWLQTLPWSTSSSQGPWIIPTMGAQKVKVSVGETGSGTVNVIITGGTSINALTQSIESVNTYPSLYNGTTWDTQRNNLFGTALTSATRTSTTTSSDITNHNARGALIFWDLTANPSAGSIKLRIQGKDEYANKYYYVHADWGNVTGVATRAFLIYPGCSTAVGDIVQVTNGVLPRTWRIEMVHAGGSSITYSVTYSLIV